MLLENEIKAFLLRKGVYSILFPETNEVFRITNHNESKLKDDASIDIFMEWIESEGLDINKVLEDLREHEANIDRLVSLPGKDLEYTDAKSAIGYLCTGKYTLITADAIVRLKSTNQYITLDNLKDKLDKESAKYDSEEIKLCSRSLGLEGFVTSSCVVSCLLCTPLVLSEHVIVGVIGIGIGIVGVVASLIYGYHVENKTKVELHKLHDKHALVEKRIDEETYRRVLQMIV